MKANEPSSAMFGIAWPESSDSDDKEIKKGQMSLNRGMNTENEVHLHMEYYSGIKNNDFMKFAD
jgi:hypothetical protein